MSVAAKADELLKTGEIWGEIHTNLAKTLLIMSDSLIKHARNGEIEPQFLSRDMERLEAIMHALASTGKVAGIDANDQQVVIPILAEVREELGRESANQADVSETGEVCAFRVDA